MSNVSLQRKGLISFSARKLYVPQFICIVLRLGKKEQEKIGSALGYFQGMEKFKCKSQEGPHNEQTARYLIDALCMDMTIYRLLYADKLSLNICICYRWA